MNTTNYQKALESKVQSWSKEGVVPSILLHCCCAPCSSYCLEYLNPHFDIYAYYYNPNITDKAEYEFRMKELKRLIETMPKEREIHLIEGDFEPEKYLNIAKGLEEAPERGPRCVKCYELRLAAASAKRDELGLDLFATTLTLSPLKPAAVINELGSRYDNYLATDFKKNNGYLRSIELSKEYNLYRQNFCGCEYSRRTV